MCFLHAKWRPGPRLDKADKAVGAAGPNDPAAAHAVGIDVAEHAGVPRCMN